MTRPGRLPRSDRRDQRRDVIAIESQIRVEKQKDLTLRGLRGGVDGACFSFMRTLHQLDRGEARTVAAVLSVEPSSATMISSGS